MNSKEITKKLATLSVTTLVSTSHMKSGVIAKGSCGSCGVKKPV